MKLRANASQHSNRDHRRIAEELLAEAERVDREEDEQFGRDSRGDETSCVIHEGAGVVKGRLAVFDVGVWGWCGDHRDLRW
jgi:hypothetical protein